jgi:hypothetical protein
MILDSVIGNEGTRQMFTYLPANQTAGYSGFVIYGYYPQWNNSVWMIPGTFFHDWDN